MKFLLCLLFVSTVAFGRGEITITKNDSIAPGNDNSVSEIIADGKTVTLQKFGCLDPAINDGVDSWAILQWGSDGSSWDPIRACSKNNEFKINRDFTGDGDKRFRIVRRNKSAVSKTFIIWMEALVK